MDWKDLKIERILEEQSEKGRYKRRRWCRM